MTTDLQAPIAATLDGTISGSQVAVGNGNMQVSTGGGDCIINHAMHRPPRPREAIRVLARPQPELVGRDGAVALALATVAEGEPVQVHGRRGVGKTALLRHLAHASTGAGREVLFVLDDVGLDEAELETLLHTAPALHQIGTRALPRGPPRRPQPAPRCLVAAPAPRRSRGRREHPAQHALPAGRPGFGGFGWRLRGYRVSHSFGRRSRWRRHEPDAGVIDGRRREAESAQSAHLISRISFAPQDQSRRGRPSRPAEQGGRSCTEPTPRISAKAIHDPAKEGVNDSDAGLTRTDLGASLVVEGTQPAGGDCDRAAGLCGGSEKWGPRNARRGGA